jgi:hypothetical protein
MPIHELLQPGRPIFGMAATYTNGHRDHALAVNEVAVTRLSVHSANIRSRQHRLRSLVAALLRASYANW